MATLEQLSTALKNADAAGDCEDARKLAMAISRLTRPMATEATPVGVQTRPGPGISPADFQGALGLLSGASQQIGQDQSANPDNADNSIRTRMEARKLLGETATPYAGVQRMSADGSLSDATPQGGGLQGAGDFIDQAIMGTPFIDEIYSATAGNIGRMMRDGVGPIEGYKREKALQDALTARRFERSPMASTGGRIASAIGTGSALAKGGLSLAGRLSTGASIPARMGALAADNAALSGLYGAGEGNGLQERAANALQGATVGAAFGAAVPAASAALSAAGRGIKGAIAPWLGGASNAEREAGRRVAKALAMDRGNASGGALSANDVAAGLDNGQPLTVADIGGETTRSLARTAANVNPEARAALERFASDRFASQSDRAIEAVKRTVGTNADDMALQDALRSTARNVNEPAYAKAFASKGAQALYGPELQRLMQAPAMQEAAKQATTRGANRAAVEGFEAIRNPFKFEAGGVSLASERVQPTLRFWDQTKRNLDSMIDVAKRQGDRAQVADLSALKSQLVQTLDNAVPDYAAARNGAAQFFKADNAVDAGKQFAKASKMLPEYQRGFLAMSAPEKEAFKTGFASEIIDTIKAAPDRVNVIRKVFGSPEARQKMVLAFGANEARQLEAFVRVENTLDAFRGAFGNSTTARQLVDAGIMGGTGLGTWYATGDWKTGIAAGLATKGARFAGQRIDAKVMRHVADVLLSDNPELIKRLAQNAAISKQHLAALDAITRIAQGGTSAGTSVFTADQLRGRAHANRR